PGSATTDVAPPASTRRTPRIPAFGSLQPLARYLADDLVESPRHYPDNDVVAVTDALAWVDRVPAYGLVAAPVGGARSGTAPTPPDPVVVDERGMNNGLLAIAIDGAGRVSLEEIATGRRIGDLVGLEDEVDVGDLYTVAM